MTLSTYSKPIPTLVTVLGLWLAAGVPSVYAQSGTRVDVRLDPQSVEVGQTFTYTIDASSDSNDQIRLTSNPGFGQFPILGRTSAPQFVIRNNVANRRHTFTYTVRATEVGEFAIEPPQIQIGDNRYTPQALKLKVVESGQGRASATPRPNQNLFIDVTVTPDRQPYVGEQLHVTYDLYVDTRETRVRPRPPTEPSLDDFWVEDLSASTSGRRQMMNVDGRFMEKTPLRAFAVFPLKAGPATLESMTLPIIRGGFFGPTTEDAITSQPLELEVQPLPPNAPPGFADGNVGQWRFSINVDTRSTRVGSPITLQVTANGVGRAGRVTLPELPEIEGVRVLDSNTRSTSNLRNAQVHGTKTTRISLMPVAEGTFTIPALVFSYFDPQAGEYQTIESPAIPIQVEPGELPPEPVEGPQPDVERTSATDFDTVAALVSTLRSPRQDFSPGPTPEDAPLAPSGLWLALLLGALGCGVMLLFDPVQRQLERGPLQRRRQKALWRLVKADLDRAEAPQCSFEEACDEIISAIRRYVTQRLQIAPGAVTSAELADHLEARNIPEALGAELVDIVETCTQSRFARRQGSGSGSAAGDLVQRCRACLKAIEAGLPATSPAVSPTSNTSTTILLIGLSVAAMSMAAPPAFAVDAPTEPDWDELLVQYPDHPTMLYNAGTEYAQRGQYAVARRHLERASLRAPLDRDIRANLTIVRQILHHERHTSPNTPREGLGAWKAAASVPGSFFIAGATIAFWLIFLGLFGLRRARLERMRQGSGLLVTLGVLLLLTAIGLGLAQRTILDQVEAAVVVADSPVLRQGPSSHAANHPQSKSVTPGMLVRILESRDSWHKVEVFGEATGWIVADDVAVVD